MAALTIDHTPDCMAVELNLVPSLIVQLSPSRGAGTVMMRTWERCDICYGSTGYEQGRVPWRTFHRAWRANMAVWIATWEHRHQIGGRVTGS